jgi:hypothetical protein
MSKRTRSIGIYPTYKFVDQDPIVSKVKTVLQDEAAARGINLSKMVSTCCTESRVSRTTVSNWLDRTTKRPQAASMNAILRAVDHELAVVKRRK